MSDIGRILDDLERTAACMELILEALNHTTLERRGAVYVGLCPLHDERTPSFHVSFTKPYWHCFGCNRSGDRTDLIAAVRERAMERPQ
jgi:DNA primase